MEGFLGIFRASRSEEISNYEDRIEKDERQVEEYMKKLQECNDGRLCRFYEERLNVAQNMLAYATEEYKRLHQRKYII